MNDSPITIAEARTLVAAPLWPRIRAFLWDFASLCDPARLVAALSLGGSGVSPDHLPPRLAREALRSLGLSPVFHSFPASDGSRLLLLSREDYDRLAQFLGVVAFAPALRRVTLGADVRALRAALPGIYPETLAFAPYFHRFEALFASLPGGSGGNAPRPLQAEAVSAAGHSLLALALSSLPPPLLLRQRLRFPEGSSADVALANLGSGSVPEASASGSALAAAQLALKLSNLQEYKACFS